MKQSYAVRNISDFERKEKVNLVASKKRTVNKTTMSYKKRTLQAKNEEIVGSGG